MEVVRLPLPRRFNLKPRHSRASNRLNSKVSNKVNNKASSKVNSQYDPASPCLVVVVVDVEEAGPMCLQASVEPVALKRADMVMLAAEVEEDAEVAVVE